MGKPRKKIVTIGGGTGSSVVLSGLKEYPVQISAVVSMMDSGGSTGRLVRDLKVHPMGDVRQALLALSKADPGKKDFFCFRFSKGELLGHNAGNIFLAAFEKIDNNFEQAIETIKDFLEVKGDVIPVTLQKTDLIAYLKNGKKLVKEEFLELLSQKKSSLKKLGLTKKSKANPKAIKAIKEAGTIIICPGNPCRSVLPNFLVAGISQAVKKSKAKVIFVANLMNKKGQTDKMTLSQVISFYEKYTGRDIVDVVVYNTDKFKKDFLKKYRLKDESLLKIDQKNLFRASYKTVGASLLTEKISKQDKADVFLKRTAIRHDPKKLAKIIMEIVNNSK